MCQLGEGSWCIDRVTVGWPGEIDLANASAAGDDVCRAVNVTQGEIVVDFSKVTFIDSTGIAMIIRVHQYATFRGTIEERRAQLAPAGALRRTGVETGLKLSGEHPTGFRYWPGRGFAQSR
jgi:anti-anti-sigma regulatory factor